MSDEDSEGDRDSEEEGDEPTEPMLIPVKGAKPSDKPKNTKTPLKNGKSPEKVLLYCY